MPREQLDGPSTTNDDSRIELDPARPRITACWHDGGGSVLQVHEIGY